MQKTFLLFFFKGIGALSSLLLGMIVSRFYGVDVFGDFGILLAYIAILSLFATWGINIFIVENNLMLIHGRVLKFWLLISFFVSIISAFVFYIKFDNFYLCFMVFIVSLLTIKGSFLMLVNKQYYNALLDDFLKYVLPILFIVIGYYFFNKKYFFNIYLFSQVVLFLISIHYLFKFVKYSENNISASFNDLLVYGGVPTLSALLVLLNAQFDRLILSHVVSKEMVGIYFAAQNLMALITYATVSIMMVITPDLVRFYKEREFVLLRKISIKYCILLTGFSIFILSFSVLFADYYFQFYGIKSSEGYYSLLILLVGITLSQFFGFGMTILIYTQHKKKLLYYQGFVFLISSILCFVLSEKFGIVGAACSTAFGLVLIKFLIWLDFKRQGISLGLI